MAPATIISSSSSFFSPSLGNVFSATNSRTRSVGFVAFAPKLQAPNPLTATTTFISLSTARKPSKSLLQGIGNDLLSVVHGSGLSAFAAIYGRYNYLDNDKCIVIFASVDTLGGQPVRSVAAPVEDVAGFDDMVAGTQRKYYMLGGKGGVGKTSCAASLAVKFANSGHPTLVVSTDPAHSLSDSFAQDLTGGTLVQVEGPDYPLFALELNPEKAREEFRTASQQNGGTGVKDFMEGMGLGMLVEQLGELKLGELLDTPPPGLDEAIAISKVIQFLESEEYNMFTRIVFDTAPTGHTLRLLSLPDFLDASIGKILKLRQKISSATSAIKSVFGQEENRPDAADKLEKLRERMIKVRELFRDVDSTEFVIVTIPTVMAVSESSRLCASLEKENVPVKRLIVNQLLPPSVSDCKFCAMKRKDQTRALDMIQDDPELSTLRLIKAPLVDVEIRGVPALKFIGDIIWK